MAIIRSHSVANGKKSAGMITYRHTKGRVIASQKRGSSEKSKEAFLGVNNARCNAFGLLQLFSKVHAASIDISFESTKFGTPRNKFCKLNMDAFRGIEAAIKASNPTIIDGKIVVTPDELDAAVATYCTANPTKMYRVFKSGYVTVMNTGAWDDSLTPEPIVVDSTFKLAVTCVPAAGGSVAGAGKFEPNTVATLTATASPGYEFQGYNINGSAELVTTNPLQITMDANKTVVANFAVATVKYTVTYMHQGSVYDTQQYSEGDTVTPPDPPAGYEWVGAPSTMPANDVTVTSVAE